MRRSAYRTTSGVVFGVIALLQAIRLLRQLPVTVGSTTVPVWVSGIAVVVAGSLCVWAFRPAAD